MKREILITMVSLFAFSGFVAGQRGTGLAGAQGTCVQEGTPYKKVTEECFGPDVEVVILFMKGGKLQLLEGANTSFREPKSQGGGPKTGQPSDPKEKARDELPFVLSQDITTSKFKQNEIITYGGQTCGWFNGQYWCW